jgi:hypothetical protein
VSENSKTRNAQMRWWFTVNYTAYTLSLVQQRFFNFCNKTVREYMFKYILYTVEHIQCILFKNNTEESTNITQSYARALHIILSPILYAV